MRKQFKFLFATGLLRTISLGAVGGLLLCGCASVPRESVALSRQIGVAMEEEHQAHLRLVTLFFDQKKAALDEWIAKEYTPHYLANVRAEMKNAGEKDALNDRMLADLVADVVRKRDDMHRDVEQARVALVTNLENNHAPVVRANAQLTAFLQSAVNVHDAAAGLENIVRQETGNAIDFDALE